MSLTKPFRTIVSLHDQILVPMWKDEFILSEEYCEPLWKDIF